MKKIGVILFLMLLTNACFVNQPTYHMTGTHEVFPSNITSKKWTIYFDHFSASAEQEVKKQIMSDFQMLFKDNISFHTQFLNVEGRQSVIDRMDAADLESIFEETQAEILAVFKIQMKYQTQNKVISIQKVKQEKHRMMFLFLDIYNLQTKEVLYAKYAVSQLKLDDSGSYLAETSVKAQAIKTYEKLQKDVIKLIDLK